MKQMPFYLIMLVLSLIYSCENKKQSVSIDNLIVGKWRMVEYGSSYVNALDTLSFYRSGKADCQPEMGGSSTQLCQAASPLCINLGRRDAIFNRVSSTRNRPQRKVT